MLLYFLFSPRFCIPRFLLAFLPWHSQEFWPPQNSRFLTGEHHAFNPWCKHGIYHLSAPRCCHPHPLCLLWGCLFSLVPLFFFGVRLFYPFMLFPRYQSRFYPSLISIFLGVIKEKKKAKQVLSLTPTTPSLSNQNNNKISCKVVFHSLLSSHSGQKYEYDCCCWHDFGGASQ